MRISWAEIRRREGENPKRSRRKESEAVSNQDMTVSNANQMNSTSNDLSVHGKSLYTLFQRKWDKPWGATCFFLKKDKQLKRKRNDMKVF